MGAWGIGHFDNDAAGDWMLELEDARSLAPVVDAFDEVDASLDYLDADIGSIALAAAETVAAVIGKPADDLPESVAEIAASLKGAADSALVSRARASIEKVGAQSELRELWEETDSFDEWQSLVANLIERLRQA